MSRRSGRSLTFKDAVRLLDDGSPFVRDLDELISQAFDAVPAGKLMALPYFAFRRKLVAYGEKVVSGIRDRVDGLGRYDRTQRLHAAHAVILMTAFAEALGELLDGAVLRVERGPGTVRLSEAHGALVLTFDSMDTFEVRPSQIKWIETLYDNLAQDVSRLLSTWGLEGAGELLDELPARGRRRYAEHYRRLAAEIPEFAVWAYLGEHEATRAELRDLRDELRPKLAPLTTGLAAVPELLAEVSGRAAANRVRLELARAYQAVLERSVLGETHAPDGVVLPTLERGYVNPAARAAVIDSSDHPSEDRWWNERTRYDDIQALLIGELTAAHAVNGPLVILGQPGAGKSVLTRILSARLADRGFLPVRVELRNVPADTDVQTQIEHAIHDTIGRTVQWPDLAESAQEDGLLPLIILDGFDELLQATGVNRSDYLEQVARFQRRELDLKRPVTAIVTSRTAVADRARFPGYTSTLRIEPFDEARVTTWLSVWNSANGTSLSAETMFRYGELAEQPLLLTLLALYDAGSGALASADAGLSHAELYDRLLSEFARREVRKSDEGLDSRQEARAVADELHRLEIVALAMFNRHAKAITGEELDRDLAALLPADRAREHGREGLAKPLTAAQITVGRFFFVHESSARRAGETEHAYEFLHATFGEFLVARHVLETLRSLARLRAFQESEGTVSPLDDGKLWAALSFAALTGSKASVEFISGLLNRLPDDERAAVRELTVELLHEAAYANPRRSLANYEQDRMPVYARHAYYSANLTALAVLSTGEPLDSHPFDMDTWRKALRYDEFDGLRNTIRVISAPGEEFYDMRIVCEDGSPVDPRLSGIRMRVYDGRLDSSDQFFVDPAVQANSEAGILIRESAFGHRWDDALAALLPYFEFLGGGVRCWADDGGLAVPVARALLELRLAPFASHGALRRCELYKWCFRASRTWSDFAPRWLNVVLRQLREDVRELEPSKIASLLQEALEVKELVELGPQGFVDVVEALRAADEAVYQYLVDTDVRVRELIDRGPEDTRT